MQAVLRASSMLALTVAFAAPCLSEVLTVDPNGGADFTSLQAAIDAAQDGDTLSLAPGTYLEPGAPHFVVTNKDLRIVAPGAAPEFFDRLDVTDLDASKTVVLSNLDLVLCCSGLGSSALRIEDCAGSVRVHDMPFVRSPTVVNSADVVFTRSLLRGASGDDDHPPGDGLLVYSSNVAAFSCTLLGGHADQQPAILSQDAADGGSGCRVDEGAFVYLAACSLVGGDGGNSHIGDFLDPPVDGGDGGDGLRVHDGDVVVLDCQRTGGAAGAGGECSPQFPNCGPPGDDGVPGQGTVVENGSVDELAGDARSAEIPSIVQGSDSVSVTFHGEPGDQVFLLEETGPDFVYDPAWRGVWAQPAGVGPQIGVIPGSGSLVYDLELPVGAACEGTAYPFFQAAFIDTSVQPVQRFLATPVAMTQLDPTPGFPTTCSSNPNSTGQVGRIAGAGSHDAADEALTLSADLLPTQKIGYFLFSTNQVFVPLFGGSQGNLCVGGPLLRYLPPVLNTGTTGSVQLVVDFDAVPAGATLDPGETWYFQLWYRDTNPGSTSNTTEALVVEFCP